MTDVAVWVPVAAAFKLDTSDFEQRVIGALPRIVRQGQDLTTAERLARQLRALQIDARVLPHDEQLVYIQRAGSIRGPLPRCALETFIETGESYRLRGDQEWRPWVAAPPVNDVLAPASTGPINQETPPPLPDEPAPPPLPDVSAATPPTFASVSASPPVDDVPPPLPSADHSPSAAGMNLAEPPPLPTATPIPPLAATVPGATPPPLPTPSSGPAPTKPGDGMAMRLLLPVGRSGLAIAAGYLGLLAIIPGVAPITLVVSILAWRNLQKHPGKHGRGRTVFGLLMGSLITLATIMGVCAWLYASHNDAPAAAPTSAHAAKPRVLSAQPAPPPASTPLPQAASAASTPSTDVGDHREVTAVAPAADPASTATNEPYSATEHCDADAPHPQAPEEVTLLANGQRHLTGNAVRAGTSGEIYIVEAALGYDGMCRPSPYQIYVFNRGELVGTLATDPMQARSDGAITDFKLADPDHLQIVIEHYKPSDPLCCASSHETRLIALSQFGMPSPAAAAAPAPLPDQDTGGPSFDCAMARSITDMMICTDSTLSRQDLEQAQLYRQAMAQASPDNASKLKASQQQWLHERTQSCAADKACLQRTFDARIAVLKQEYPLPAPVAQP